MAKQDEKSVIGFNPPAWVDDATKNVEQKPAEEVVVVDDSTQEISCEKAELNNNVEPEKPVDKAVIAAKIVLDATLNIQTVGVLCDQLKTLLENSNYVEIDASAVVVIDTSILQLLLVLKQTAIKLNKVVSIDFPSDKFIEASDLLGVSEVLGVDHAAAGFF